MSGVKKIGLSISDYVYGKYLLNFSGNRSKFIESMFVRGIEAELSEVQNNSVKLIDAFKRIRELEDKNSQLVQQLESLKKKYSKQWNPPDHVKKVMEFDDAIEMAGGTHEVAYHGK